MSDELDRIDCMKCRHFYVTWDRKFPKGCRAMGFKSREIPSLAVFRSSGVQCLRFEAKTREGQGSGT
jgi:hypothetical protein